MIDCKRNNDFVLQSAIGEGMTRRDHSDVSNQVRLYFLSITSIAEKLCLCKFYLSTFLA
jgi:vacuolar-type H+-ATPase subunit B/Vma2